MKTIVCHSALTSGTAGLLFSLIMWSETCVPIGIGSISFLFPRLYVRRGNEPATFWWGTKPKKALKYLKKKMFWFKLCTWGDCGNCVTSNYGFLSDNRWEDLGCQIYFNNSLHKYLTITQIAWLNAIPKLHNGIVYR